MSCAYAGGSVWSALASFQHFWTPQLSTAISADYANMSGAVVGTSGSKWQAAINLVWAPVTGFSAGLEGGYSSPLSGTTATGTWNVKARLKRTW